MRCEHARRELAELALSRESHPAAAFHVAACADCAHELASLERVLDAVASAAPAYDLAPRVSLATLDARVASRRRLRRGLAAAVLVAASLLVLALAPAPEVAPEPKAVVAVAEPEPPFAEPELPPSELFQRASADDLETVLEAAANDLFDLEPPRPVAARRLDDEVEHLEPGALERAIARLPSQ